MPIRLVLSWATEILSSRLDAELLLAFILKASRVYLFTWPEQDLPIEIVRNYKKIVLRRLKGKPVAYIVGYKEFWSLPLKVNSKVLIPRPETEVLVEQLLKHTANSSEPLRILELGTGSGAIAIAVAFERPHWEIVATDISEAALRVAKQNAKKLNIRSIDWLSGDWFTALSSLEPNKRKFNVVVSNPPYIAKRDPHLLNSDLAFEPKNALIAGKTGLECIQKIIANASKYLLPGGLLFLEHGYQQAADLKTCLKKYKFINLKTYKDLAGVNRVTVGFYKKSKKDYK